MKVFYLPKEILYKIDQNSRNCFWGHSGENRKIYTISWEKITCPKFSGGLGIRKAKHQNKIYMLSLIWKLFNSPENEWSRVIKNKYGVDLKKKKYH